MKPTPGKKVLVLGLGRSGFESAKFLHSESYEVFVSENSSSDSAQAFAQDLSEKGIPYELGGHTFDRFGSFDFAVVSPGIRPSSKSMQVLKEKGIPAFSEIEVASWFSKTNNVIAITGTVGKTTVSSLLGSVLSDQFSEGRVCVCGNIGNPWIGEISKIKKEDFVIVETSSFQLSLTERFRPRFAALLNLSENHLDWHPDMKDYVRSKLKVFLNQSEKDVSFLRQKDQSSYFPEMSFKSRVIYFGSQHENPNHEIVLRMAYELGCDLDQAKRVIHDFEGIEHRLEGVALINGVRFINDSKSTTTASLAWALQKFEDKKVVLIAGGKAKSNDFQRIQELVAKKTKAVILIGEASKKIRLAWDQDLCINEAESLHQAIQIAQDFAQEGDAVLLSPACASFDMFQSYEDRGSQFKALVNELFQAKVN